MPELKKQAEIDRIMKKVSKQSKEVNINLIKAIKKTTQLPLDEFFAETKVKYLSKGYSPFVEKEDEN